VCIGGGEATVIAIELSEAQSVLAKASGEEMRRIVVTGMGAVSPLAAGVEASWSRLLAGRSGIRRLPDEVVADLPTKIGGVVPSIDEDPTAGFDPDTVMTPKDQRKVDRFILFAVAAADEALSQAAWRPATEQERRRTATIIASGIGGFPRSPRPCGRWISAVSDGFRLSRSRPS
jgi:3-oxoacyl-(acyl-carrier-protein) synthase